MLRRTSTPLYEVMVKRPARADAPPPPAGPDHDEPVAEDPAARVAGTLPGRTVRLPMGYLLVAVAAALGALLVVYMVGWRLGGQAERQELEQAFTTGPWADDPLAGADGGAAGQEDALVLGVPGAETPGGELRDARPRGPSRATGGGGSAPTSGASWGPIESDPRRDGLHYPVLAETRPEGALRLARFCRDHGLEAYVVDGHNPRFRRVIVLPGVSSRSESDAEVVGLMERVHQVGRAWKARYPAESDLRDAYLFP